VHRCSLVCKIPFLLNQEIEFDLKSHLTLKYDDTGERKDHVVTALKP